MADFAAAMEDAGAPAPTRCLVAGGYIVDVRDERVWRAGKPVQLGGKSFGLLLALMENPQTLVTKEELLDRVWPNLAISESVLTTGIKELRRGLGDDARQPLVIETVHGRGYRFLLPVTVQDGWDCEPAAAVAAPAVVPTVVAASRAAPAARYWLAAGMVLLIALGAVWLWPREVPNTAAAAATTLVHQKSVAVVPFVDLSRVRDHGWFAEGLTEEVLGRLARIPDLQVAARVAATPGGAVDVRALARTLNVAHVLQGTVQHDGARIRVTAGLIRAADGFQIWSQTYDRPMRDVIPIQEDIAFRLAQALNTVMDPAKLRVMADAGTRSVEAYEAYLRGLTFDQRQQSDGDAGHARAAVASYERARAIDPGFAAAHWKAAQNWFGKSTRISSEVRERDMPEAVRLAKYFERVDAAIAASRDDTEQLKYRAARAVMQLQFAAAHRDLVRYLAARPRDIDAWEDMGDVAAYVGQRVWMARAAERVHTLSMESGVPRSRGITLSVMSLQLDAAVARANQQLALRPDNALTQYQAHRALIWDGQAPQARALLARIEASALPEDNKLLARLRQTCAEDGRDALALRARLGPDTTLSSRWLAAQLTGDRAGATALLRPLDTPEHVRTLMQFLVNPSFDPRPYPLLSATLTQNGITPPPPVPMPFACQART